MGLRRELKQQQTDYALDDLLQSGEGREAWWETLKAQAEQDSMVALLESTIDVPGAIMECGVYRGYSLFRMCRALGEHQTSKQVIACDTFQGFPPESVTGKDTTLLRPVIKLRSKFRIADDVPGRIQRFSEAFHASISICRGKFQETLPELLLDSQLRFSFIHLDVDLYDSYKCCLDLLYDRLNPGGIVVFDDYESARWPGAKRAVDEFFDSKLEKPTKSFARHMPSWYVKKPCARSSQDATFPIMAESVA